MNEQTWSVANRCFSCIGTLAAAALLIMPAALSGQSYTLSSSENGMLLKTPDGRPVFEYMLKKPEGSALTAPSTACFHPVYTPKGDVITNIAPSDHPHHRGIWFGWQDSEFREEEDVSKGGPNHPARSQRITRADFWGWGVFAPRDGRVITTKSITLVHADAKQAVLEIHNDWNVTNRKMLDEFDTATVSERDGVFVIDLVYRLTPIANYKLNQSGFGGFALQARKDGDNFYYSTPNGKMTGPDPHYAFPDSDRPDDKWWDFSIEPRPTQRFIGAAVINSPTNPPTWWHNTMYLWMLNPSITAMNTYTIPANTTLTLRYRVITHDGPPPVDVLNRLATQFREQN
jgi:hypothetical protein